MMSSLDLNPFLEPVSPDSPCGDDLEYDPLFSEMERSAQGKPEQQYGDTIVPAEEPDWREVKLKGLDLLQRTRDLRVGVHLARALLHTDEFPGLCAATGLLRGFVEQHWEQVHPQLDPDDDNDPTLRVNTLMTLCDPEATLLAIRQTPLVRSRAVGSFHYQDVQIASGELPGPEEDGPQMSNIEAAALDCDIDELKARYEAVGATLENVRAIESAVTSQVGASQAPNFEQLRHLLQAMQRFLHQQLERRGGLAGSEAPEAEDAAAEPNGGDGQVAAAGAAPVSQKGISGQVTSREDVMQALEMICTYYDRYEPSSPIPLLLRRAKRLATKNFLEIIRDLTPDALGQAEAIGGVDREHDSDES